MTLLFRKTTRRFLKKKISETGINQKAVAAELQIPYSTLRDMLSNVGSARVDNVIKLCRYLGIAVSELDISADSDLQDDVLKLTDEHEIKVIKAYRDQQPVIREAIDRILQVPAIEHKLYRAARSSDNHEPEIIETDKDLSQIPPTKLRL